MNILIEKFHPGYTCMLCRCPHEFYMRIDTASPLVDWDRSTRPKPSNLHFLTGDWGGPYDVAVFPVAGIPCSELPPVKCPCVYLHLWDAVAALHPLAYRCRAWVFLSDENARIVNAQYAMRTRIIEYGIDPVEYGGWVGKGPHPIAIGHHLAKRWEKGYDNLVAVSKGVPLEVLGYGNEELPRHRYIDSYAEFLEALRRAPVFLNPSNYVPESAIEMMVLGAPVVQFEPKQYQSIFEDGVTCRIVKSPVEAIHHIKELFRNPGEGQKLGAAARARAKQRFSLEQFTAQWNRVFEEAVK
jgi:hypothetical protein